jgi:hypothetical protein
MSDFTDFLGLSQPGEDLAAESGWNLRNFYGPGGTQGGAVNTMPTSGYGGSPLNEGDWRAMNNIWGTIRPAANFTDIDWTKVAGGGQDMSAEGRQFIQDNWNTIRPAANFGDIDWGAQGIVGQPGYAPAPDAAAQPVPGIVPGIDPAAPAGPTAADPTNILPEVGVSQTGTSGVLGDPINVFANLAGNPGAGADPAIADALRGSAVSNLANSDPRARSDQILALMREQAAPYEKEKFDYMNQKLHQMGRLSVAGEDSTMGKAYKEFARGIGEADTLRQMGAIDAGERYADSAHARGISSAQGSSAYATDTVERMLGGVKGLDVLVRAGLLPAEMAIRIAQARSGANAAGSQAVNQSAGMNIFDMWTQGTEGFGNLFGAGSPFGGATGRWGK